MLREPPPRTFSLEEPGPGPRVVRGLAVERPAWTGPKTQLLLHGLDGPARLELLLRPNRDQRDGTGKVRLARAGRLLAELVVEASARRYAVTLDEGATAGPWLAPEPIDLSCEGYDSRREADAVGVRLFELTVTPLPAWRIGRAAWLMFVLVASTSLLRRLDRRLFAGRQGEMLRVLLPGTLVAAGLVSWARLDPYGLAWYLPPLPTAVAFAVAAAALLLRGRSLPAAGDRRAMVSPPTRLFSLAVVALLLILAFGLRLHRIREIPQGMWRDEARHALVALRIMEDPEYRPLYVAQRNPKINLPGLGFFLFVPGLWAFGIEPWSLRVVTAVAGALTVIPAYGLARRLLGEGAAPLAGVFLASATWHLILSRYAFPTVFDALFTTTALWLIAWATGSPKPRARLFVLLAAGVLLGLAAQTYHTGRLAPVLGAVLLAFLLPRDRERRAAWAAWGAGLLVALLPMGLWALQHPGEFGDRVGEVALLARAPGRAEAPLTALDQSLFRHLLMFNVRGDGDGHHNLPYRPMLDGLTGLGFLAGLWLFSRRGEKAGPRFLLVAVGLGVLPSLLAIDGPNGLRAAAAVVPACFVAAGGWAAFLSRVRAHAGPRLARASLGLLVAVVTGFNAYAYFVERPRDPRVWRAMYPVETAMGLHLRGFVAREPLARVFVPSSAAEESVFQYLAYRIPFATFEDGKTSAPVGDGDRFLAAGTDLEKTVEALEAFLGPEPAPVFVGAPLPGTKVPSFVAYSARGPSR